MKANMANDFIMNVYQVLNTGFLPSLSLRPYSLACRAICNCS